MSAPKIGGTPDTEAQHRRVKVVNCMKVTHSMGGLTTKWRAATMDQVPGHCEAVVANINAAPPREDKEEVLSVSGYMEFTGAYSDCFLEQVLATLNGHRVIEVELSGTTVMDCGGFGALMALRNATRDDRVRLRLLNPAPPVERLLDILHAERVFEIIPSRPCSQMTLQPNAVVARASRPCVS